MSGAPLSLEETFLQLLDIRFPTVPMDALWCQLLSFGYAGRSGVVNRCHFLVCVVDCCFVASELSASCVLQFVFAPPQHFDIPPGLVM